MAPLKLEDNIREQFEGRQIPPSDAAWTKLSSRLDEQSEKQKRKFGVYWWAVAATIVGMILIGTLIFKSDPQQEQNELVQEQTLEEVQTETPVSPATNELVEVAPVDQQDAVVKQDEAPREQLEQPVNKQLLQAPKTQQAVAVVETTQENIQENIKSDAKADVQIQDAVAQIEVKTIQDDPIKIDPVEAKVNEVVDIIRGMEANNAAVTEAEIADLLQKAQRDLKTKSMINMETLKVDANALLMDVEYDLERSFRDKVFDALGEGYNKIRTAMATRNN